MTELRSVLIGTSALSLALAVAFLLTIVRPLGEAFDSTTRDRLLRIFFLGLGIQCLHSVEEFITGFHIRFPEFLGLTAWSAEFFVAFNLVWIAIWVFSGVALKEGLHAALFPIWFFAIGMTLNGVAHPLLSLVTGGYFPGLVTSPVVGIAGAVLLSRLLAATRRMG